jgi:hypothetical protein
MPDTQQDYVDSLSPRLLALLRRAIRDYRAVREIQPLAQADLQALFDAVYNREYWLASKKSEDIEDAQFIEDYRSIDKETDQPNFVEQWTESFLETILELRESWTSYSDAVTKYNIYIAGLHKGQHKADDHPELTTLGYQLGQAGQIMGMDAAGLGRYEAHWQMRRLLQVFFARYSADIRLLGTPWRKLTRREVTIPNDPRPDLREFSRRENLRRSWMPQEGQHAKNWRIDEALHYVGYLDALAEDGSLPSWTGRTRPIYVAERLLIPGLLQAEGLLAKIFANYSSLKVALQRWNEDTKFSDNVDQDLQNIAALRLVQARVIPTSCLMNALRHARYISRTDGTLLDTGYQLRWLTQQEIIHDAFEDHAFTFSWQELDKKIDKRRRELHLARQQARQQRRKTETAHKLAEHEARLEELRLRLDMAKAAENPEGFIKKIVERQQRKALRMAIMAEEAEIRSLRQQQEREQLAEQRQSERAIRQAREEARKQLIVERQRQSFQPAPIQTKQPRRHKPERELQPKIELKSKQPRPKRLKVPSQELLSRKAAERRARREEAKFKRGQLKP